MSRLQQLAINEEGFVFDPTTGESFTVNSTGLMILNALKEDKTSDEIARELMDKFETNLEVVEKDLSEFISHLRTYKLK